MNTFQETRIIVGLILSGRMTVSTLDRFYRMASDVMRTFHPRSSCFWRAKGAGDDAWEKAFTAGLYEAYRQQSEYLVFALSPGVTLPLVVDAVRTASADCLEGLSVSAGEDRILLLLRAEAAQRAAGLLKPEEWATLTEKKIFALLKRAKVKIAKGKPSKEVSFSIVPDAYHLPSDVTFAPSPGKPAPEAWDRPNSPRACAPHSPR